MVLNGFRGLNTNLSKKVDTTDSRLSDARTPLSHTHDDRYYTETEVNDLLNAKQNSDTAITTSNIGRQSVNYANGAGDAARANFLNTQTIVSESDADKIGATGVYFVANSKALIFHLRYDDNFSWQMWFSFGTIIYARVRTSGVWGEWKTLHQ